MAYKRFTPGQERHGVHGWGKWPVGKVRLSEHLPQMEQDTQRWALAVDKQSEI